MIIKQCLIKTYVLPPPSPHLIIDNKLNWSVQESDPTFYHNMLAQPRPLLILTTSVRPPSEICNDTTSHNFIKWPFCFVLCFLSAERIIALTTSLLFSVPVGHLRHVSRKLLVSSGLWPDLADCAKQKR